MRSVEELRRRLIDGQLLPSVSADDHIARWHKTSQSPDDSDELVRWLKRIGSQCAVLNKNPFALLRLTGMMRAPQIQTESGKLARQVFQRIAK